MSPPSSFLIFCSNFISTRAYDIHTTQLNSSGFGSKIPGTVPKKKMVKGKPQLPVGSVGAFLFDPKPSSAQRWPSINTHQRGTPLDIIFFIVFLNDFLNMVFVVFDGFICFFFFFNGFFIWFLYGLFESLSLTLSV